jgi:hypothetical protein
MVRTVGRQERSDKGVWEVVSKVVMELASMFVLQWSKFCRLPDLSAAPGTRNMFVLLQKFLGEGRECKWGLRDLKFWRRISERACALSM